MSAHHLGRVGLLLLPGLAIAGVAAADLVVGANVVLGLVVVAPLLAANVAGPRLTAGYAVLALIVGVLLGFVDDVYVPGDSRTAQAVRLVVIAVMGVVSVLLSRYRIERERRLTQVTKVADAAQRAILLPVPEQLGPVRVAVTYESAASEAMIGGDLYGFVLTTNGLRVLVGDVRGKGLDAVRMSAQVLATFRERANDDRELAALMGRLDRTVARAADTEEDFVTAVLVQLTEAGHLTVANAGHPPPILLSESGPRWLLPDPTCPPLGLGTSGGLISTQMAPSDRLLLYTDGLTEARDARTRAFYSGDRIIREVSARGTVGSALDRLRADVLKWSGGVLNDDVALVLIEYQPGIETSGRRNDQMTTVPHVPLHQAT